MIEGLLMFCLVKETIEFLVAEFNEEKPAELSPRRLDNLRPPTLRIKPIKKNTYRVCPITLNSAHLCF